MTVLHRTFRSPLTLLEQWRDRIDGARLREVVVLGYTVDLAFLERFAIPTARALGARVTVVGDAHSAVHDPVDVRRAGTAYQHGHVVCSRAFHPKLVILVGDDDSALMVGSGNPTLSGWGYNRELWVTAYSSPQLGPQLVDDVADWLYDLPDVVTMASWIATTLRHVADLIRPATIDERWPSIRAYGNLHRPLLDQLPTEPVTELRLAAPFYDPPARAVTALINRLAPQSVRLTVQGGTGTFDGAALVRATEPVDSCEFRVLEPQPARHGKLIEWDLADGSTAGVTGSANITASALLRSTADDGNCELAVIAPHAESLFPDGDPRPGSVVRQMTSAQRVDEQPVDAAPVLLGCALIDGLLLIELARPAEQRVIIETSPSAVPGTWLATGIVSVGQRTARFLVPELRGGAVRAVVETNGVRRDSAVVFITDPSRCRPRRDAADQPRLQRPYQPDDLFTDPRLAQRFTADLGRLVELVGATSRPVPAASTPAVNVQANARDRWADYLEDYERSLGPGLTGLIFPHTRTHTDDGVTLTEWSIDDADEGEIADDEDEEVLDRLARNSDEASPHAVPVIRPDDRPKYRRFATRWVEAVTEPQAQDDLSTLPPVPLRMTVTALYLTLLAAGAWQEGEGWRSELRWLIWSLVPDEAMLDELPSEAFDHVYALLAVAMATLRQDAHLHGGREEDFLATDAWQECSEWVAEADLDLAEHLLLPASQPFSRVASAQDLRDTIHLAHTMKRDPYAEVRATLADAGLIVRREQNAWWVDGDFGNAHRVAARLATELGRVSSPTVAVARGPKCTVLVAAAATIMVLVDSRSAVWRLYPLTGVRTPLSLASDHPGPPPGARTVPLSTPSAEVHALSEETGVDLAALARRIRDARRIA
jgi:hypothetical protein